MQLQTGLSSFERARGDLPELPVVNLLLERGDSESIIMQSRPGLMETGTSLGDAVTQIFQRDGVLSGSQFAVSGGRLFRDGAWIGDINGTGPFSIAGYEDFLFVAGGGSLWGYDGATLVAIAFPDSANVTKVVVGASRAICLRADTETFYWSDPLTSTIDSLSFATAESQPDRLRDMLFLDDTLVLFGSETVEFWPNTGDSALPFQPLEGRVFEVGVRNTGAAVNVGPTFAWITNNHRVCLQDEQGVISNPGMEAKIRASSSASLFSFFIDSTEFLALRIDGQTHAYNSRTATWSEMASWGSGNWLPQCYSGGVFGLSDGRMAQFSSAWVDLGGVLERRFRGGVPINAENLTVDNVTLRTNVGTTGYLAGDYANPVVSMRNSRDAGRTWGAWKPRSLGEQGEYRKAVRWFAQGDFGQPGYMVEFRVTDPVDFRVSGVFVNEGYGGI